MRKIVREAVKSSNFLAKNLFFYRRAIFEIAGNLLDSAMIAREKILLNPAFDKPIKNFIAL